MQAPSSWTQRVQAAPLRRPGRESSRPGGCRSGQGGLAGSAWRAGWGDGSGGSFFQPPGRCSAQPRGCGRRARPRHSRCSVPWEPAADAAMMLLAVLARAESRACASVRAEGCTVGSAPWRALVGGGVQEGPAAASAPLGPGPGPVAAPHARLGVQGPTFFSFNRGT